MNEQSSPAISRPTLIAALCLGALPGLYLLITSTVHLVEGEFVYDVKRLLQLCLLLVLFLAATAVPGLRNAFAAQFARIPGSIKALLGLVIVLGIASSAVNATSGMHLAYSLLEVALLSMLVLGVLVIAACRVLAGEMFDQVAITLLALMAIAVGMQELVGLFAVLASGLEFHSHISLAYYSFPRFYNQVQGWTIPILAALPLLWAVSRSDLLRNHWFNGLICLTTLALNWYIILMSGGRGVAVGLLFSLALCLAFIPAIRKSTLQWQLPALLLGAALFLAIGQVHEQALGSTDLASAEVSTNNLDREVQVGAQSPHPEETDSSFAGRSLAGRLNLDSTGRWRLWRHSIEDIRNHPFLGIGPMNYACTGSAWRAAHPHNFPLQIAGEWGLPATLGLLGIVAFALISVWRALRGANMLSHQLVLAGLLVTGVLAAAGHSFFSGVLIMPASQVAGIGIGGWLLGLFSLNSEQSQVRKFTPLLVLLVGILVCTSAMAFSFAEAHHRKYREDYIPAVDQMLPRFWQQGKICKYFDAYD